MKKEARQAEEVEKKNRFKRAEIILIKVTYQNINCLFKEEMKKNNNN